MWVVGVFLKNVQDVLHESIDLRTAHKVYH